MAAEPSPLPGSAGDRLAAESGRLRLHLLHLAGRAVLARVEVEDLLQELFLRAVAAPGGLPPPGPSGQEVELRRFLARLARNTVVDAVRAIRAAKRDGKEEPLRRSDWSRVAGRDASALLAAGAGPATRAQGGESAERLARAFAALPADHRRVIGLRQFEGLTAAQAAPRLGRSEAAVHSLYRRALEAWEAALQEA